ncbi:TPA: hypothetical protein R1940_001336 [Staphylococcus delphini]|nr:hypothetical protein [Staphylococcus delphini]HEC2190264.1 hypothetical protein [Staphylococcus delphini]HEC2213462.1 hypothetical protein [Staphylococcus delphini]HEC2226226.1 hypothetical protein [Staphylococcus delphini]HEC2232163.1 hypothetical protein [Staphylococcus delphini]
MKIKVEKEMNLHELIKWAWENNVKGETFTSNYGRDVKFYSDVSFNTMEPIYHWDTFTVEVEEEVTEETVISRLVAIYDVSGQRSIIQRKQKSISNIVNEYAVAFYMLNDDATMTLLWKEGELVE